MYLKIENEGKSLLLAISSTDSLHRLGWKLNRSFGFELSKAPDHEVIMKKQIVRFELLSMSDTDQDRSVFLFDNNPSGPPLVKDLAAFDYLLKIENPYPNDDSILSELKRLPGVRVVARSDANSLKDKQHLLIE